MGYFSRTLRLAHNIAPPNSTTLLSSFLKSEPSSGFLIRTSRYFFASDSSSVTPLPKEEFDKMTKNSKVVVFMKGVPEEPKCGFSNAVVQIFRMHGVEKYDSYDVLKDERIRQGTIFQNTEIFTIALSMLIEYFQV